RRPASVSTTWRPRRSNRRTSRSCSSWAMRLLTAGWVRCSCSAAAEKPPRSATATNADRLAQSIAAPDWIPDRNLVDEKYAFELWRAGRKGLPSARRAVHARDRQRNRGMAGKTLYDKLWEMHEVTRRDDGSSLIYIGRHILHEVTSPQAFEGL